MQDATLPDVTYDRVARRLAGEFTIEGELGRGGMGAVLLATDVRLERRVAVKVLLPGALSDDVARERLLREARTAAQLSHPNIVPILRVIDDGDDTILVLGFVDGETLAQYVDARGPLGAKECARILRDVAWALGYAHSRGIVHRDIKPDNIMIERGSGRAMVMDFGIAAREGVPRLTAAGLFVGSVHYMSPELAEGEDAAPASDIYALGITGYFMLTGVLPIDGPSVATILLRQLTATPAPIAAVRKDIVAKLDEDIMRCMEKRAEDRFPTAEAFAEEMNHVVGAPLEISPLFRNWIARGELLRWVLTLWMLPAILFPTQYLLVMYGVAGPATLLTVLKLRLVAFGSGLLPALLACVVVRAIDARVVMRAGFALPDFQHAIGAWTTQRAEDRADADVRRSTLRRAIRIGGFMIAVATLVLTARMIARAAASDAASTWVLTNALTVVLLSLGYAAHMLRVDGALRLMRRRFWFSRMAPLFLAAARAGRS